MYPFALQYPSSFFDSPLELSFQGRNHAGCVTVSNQKSTDYSSEYRLIISGQWFIDPLVISSWQDAVFG